MYSNSNQQSSRMGANSSHCASAAAADIEAPAAKGSDLPPIALPLLPPSWRLSCDGSGDRVVCQQAYTVLAWVGSHFVGFTGFFRDDYLSFLV